VERRSKVAGESLTLPATSVRPVSLIVTDMAAADLAVGMIERDHGKDLARRVARGLVMRERRLGGQPQRSSLLSVWRNSISAAS
jgi:hypothetical protein